MSNAVTELTSVSDLLGAIDREHRFHTVSEGITYDLSGRARPALVPGTGRRALEVGTISVSGGPSRRGAAPHPQGTPYHARFSELWCGLPLGTRDRRGHIW